MKSIISGLLLLSSAFAAVSQPKCRVTARDIEGPYYVPGASQKKLQICDKASPAHDRLVVTGRIVSATDCRSPVAAQLDVWHADLDGKYSTSLKDGGDMSCRGIISTDKDGNFKFVTLMPGRYDDDGFRPAHIHFKITPLDTDKSVKHKPLLTQLYFKEDAFLDLDSCRHCSSEDPSLSIDLVHLADVKTFVGHWEVVLDIATNDSQVQGFESVEPPKGEPYSEQKEHILAPSDDLSVLQRENLKLKDQVNEMRQMLVKQDL